MTGEPALEIVRLKAAHVDALAAMLEAIKRDGTQGWFEPHPFDREHLTGLCAAEIRDLFYVMTAGTDVLAYGLLRGWDEGYEVPSLGIAVHPSHRGKKLGVAMMDFLHAAAAVRGSQRVRLRVYPDNEVAIGLYRRTGYRFDPVDGRKPDEPIVGIKHL